jgi:hypothetical protein
MEHAGLRRTAGTLICTLPSSVIASSQQLTLLRTSISKIRLASACRSRCGVNCSTPARWHARRTTSPTRSGRIGRVGARSVKNTRRNSRRPRAVRYSAGAVPTSLGSGRRSSLPPFRPSRAPAASGGDVVVVVAHDSFECGSYFRIAHSWRNAERLKWQPWRMPSDRPDLLRYQVPERECRYGDKAGLPASGPRLPLTEPGPGFRSVTKSLALRVPTTAAASTAYSSSGSSSSNMNCSAAVGRLDRRSRSSSSRLTWSNSISCHRCSSS